MRMDWNRLVSDLRCPKGEGEPLAAARVEDFRSAFEADYDRIIFSAPFRRLARKTQVHPMSLNDQVHTRLTHSLEVANVGRSLGRRLVGFLEKRGEFPQKITPFDLIAIIQSACLAHDIGNPPFGHAGEFAIREWVRMHPVEVFGEREAVGEGVRHDFLRFEGNAQGFRIASRGDNPQAGYLRLTVAALGAMIKYPWDSSDGRARDQGKYNVFSTEKAFFERIAEGTGMAQRNGVIARHPLSFLSEAADDICYRILDLEDAAEIRIVPEVRVRGIYRKLNERDGKDGPLAVLRGKAIQTLINGMWEVFEKNYEEIMAGRRERELKLDLNAALAEPLEEIKELYQEIFAERSKIAAELGAYKALGRIVKALCQATRTLGEAGAFGSTGFLAQRCLELAWGKEYATENEKRPYEWWLHQVMDFVAGLTDNYARQLSREIEGT